MSVPCLVLVKIEHVSIINAVFAVLASGNFQLVARLADASDPATATHYFLSDMTTNQANVDEWAGMCNGVLPAITGQWGAGDVPEADAVVTACTGGNMAVIPGYGVTDAGPFIEGMKSGYNLVAYEEPL